MKHNSSKNAPPSDLYSPPPEVALRGAESLQSLILTGPPAWGSHYCASYAKALYKSHNKMRPMRDAFY